MESYPKPRPALQKGYPYAAAKKPKKNNIMLFA